LCPKFESDDENFFKLDGIIEIKNDRKLQDKVELSQILFGLKTTHQMDKEFNSEIIDEKSKLKTFFIAGGKTEEFNALDMEFYGIIEK